MNPVHPHGTPQCGRNGCQRDECRRAFRTHDKRARVLRARMTPEQRVAAATAIIHRHLDNGTPIATIAAAAGISEATIRLLIAGQRTRIAWRVYHALRDAQVDTTPRPRDLIPRDLTVKRIHSLTALGYTLKQQGRLAGVCIVTGRWRHGQYVHAAFATAIRDLYQRIGDTPATPTSKCGATQARTWARRNGADVPASWDDPGTLAWPDGWQTDDAADEDAIDEMKVLRATEGDQAAAATLTIDERIHVVRTLNARGWVDAYIARHLGASSAHTVVRARKLGNIPPVPEGKRIERWEAA